MGKMIPVRGDEFYKFVFEFRTVLAMKVFYFLVQEVKLDNRNCVFVKQGDIGKKFGVTRQSISKAMKELREMEAIRNVNGGYMVNPNIEKQEYSKFTNHVFAMWNKLREE